MDNTMKRSAPRVSKLGELLFVWNRDGRRPVISYRDYLRLPGDSTEPELQLHSDVFILRVGLCWRRPGAAEVLRKGETMQTK